MKEWHGFLDYRDTNHLLTNFVFFNSGPLLKMFQVPKWQKVDRETKKADGLGQLNTEKQVLSKAEAFASLPTLLVPASTSGLSPLQSPHLLSGDHVTQVN